MSERDIVERLGITASMIVLGERIEFGYDAALMSEAAAEITRLRELTEWNKISNVEPPHETLVHLYSPPSLGRSDGTQEVGFASSGKRTPDPISGGTWSNMCWHGSATHWLPLPPPPKETP